MAHTHAPQWSTSRFRSVSQPFAPFPSQSPNPNRHTPVHVPALHTTVAFGPAAHACPHAPHCETLVSSAASQPLSASPSQSANPAGHATGAVAVSPAPGSGPQLAPAATSTPVAPTMPTSLTASPARAR